MSDLKDLQKRALEIRARYDQLNHEQGQKIWAGRDYVLGFVGDVGRLAKFTMAKENLRSVDEDVDARLAHELSDCLWSLLVIADAYGIDLDQAFGEAMDKLETRIKEQKR